MIADKGTYYVYRHIRLDNGSPFYIGIGTKFNIFATYETEYIRAFSKIARGVVWNRIVNKCGYKVEILLESDDYDFIRNKEIEFIKLYGKISNKGLLCNISDGGTGGRVALDYSYREKSVLELNKDTFEIINEYKSGKEASIINDLNYKCLNAVCHGDKKHVKDRLFVFKDNYNIDNLKFNREIFKKGYIHLSFKTGIYYYDLKELYKAEFPRFKTLSSFLNYTFRHKEEFQDKFITERI